MTPDELRKARELIERMKAAGLIKAAPMERPKRLATVPLCEEAAARLPHKFTVRQLVAAVQAMEPQASERTVATWASDQHQAGKLKLTGRQHSPQKRHRGGPAWEHIYTLKTKGKR